MDTETQLQRIAEIRNLPARLVAEGRTSPDEINAEIRRIMTTPCDFYECTALALDAVHSAVAELRAMLPEGDPQPQGAKSE